MEERELRSSSHHHSAGDFWFEGKLLPKSIVPEHQHQVDVPKNEQADCEDYELVSLLE